MGNTRRDIMISDKKYQKIIMYIMVNYPLIYKLLNSEPIGLSKEGWLAVYKDLNK